jgi:hypothetical protein
MDTLPEANLMSRENTSVYMFSPLSIYLTINGGEEMRRDGATLDD